MSEDDETNFYVPSATYISTEGVNRDVQLQINRDVQFLFVN